MSERVLHQINSELRLTARDMGQPLYQRIGDCGQWTPIPAHAQGPRSAREAFANLAHRVAELEAENARLRECVEAADRYINSIYSITSNTGLRNSEWTEKFEYHAARAEVDK